MFLIFDIIILL